MRLFVIKPLDESLTLAPFLTPSFRLDPATRGRGKRTRKTETYPDDGIQRARDLALHGSTVDQRYGSDTPHVEEEECLRAERGGGYH